MGQVLPNLQQQLETQAAEIAALKAALAAKSNPGLSWKVSRNGAISVYGMGRFPVTLYASQFERLSEVMPKVLEWVKTNPKTVWPADGDKPACIATLSRKGE